MEEFDEDGYERLVQRVRKIDPERFVTLCRMHLSFLLDLTSDDLDTLTDFKIKTKTKFSFTSSLHRRVKHENMNVLITRHELAALYEIMDFLSQPSNLHQEGIFRKTGNLSRQKELCRLIQTGSPLHLDSGIYSAHDCASVLKGYFSDLPMPLLTDNHFDVHCQIAGICKDTLPASLLAVARSRQIQSLKFMMLLLPSTNRNLLKALLVLLHRVCQAQDVNLMNSLNLATMFAPHILCPRKMTPEELCQISPIATAAVALMIEKALEIFKTPAALIADLKIYWENKLAASQRSEIPIDEVSLDSEAVETVVSFCDRQNGECVDTDYHTAVALAELYSHIHSLPDSVKKKQLIRKFNKHGISSPQHNQLTPQRRSTHRKSVKKLILAESNRSNDDIDGVCKVECPSSSGELDTIRHPAFFPDQGVTKLRGVASVPLKQENESPSNQHSHLKKYLSLTTKGVAYRSAFRSCSDCLFQKDEAVSLVSYKMIRSLSECSLLPRDNANQDAHPSPGVDLVRNINWHVQIFRETSV